MNKTSAFFSRRRGLLLLSAGVFCFLAPRGAAQSASQDAKAAPGSTTTPSTQAAPEQTEAQKKTAERKRRFEEQKKLLAEGRGGSAGAGASANPVAAVDNDFYVNPVALNMLANETQEIHVWDMWNNDVSARVSWGLSNNGIADMKVNRFATITAKMPGTTNVTARIDGHEIAAVVTVYRGEKLPWGVSQAVSAPPPRKTGGRRNSMTVTTSP